MADIHYLNQPPNPRWDFLREIAEQYGLAHGLHQPPPYTQANQQGSQTQGPNQEQQRTESETEQRAGPSEQQHGQDDGHHVPGGRGWRGGRGGWRGRRGSRCGPHRGQHGHPGWGRRWAHANAQRGRGFPPWGAHHGFGMPGWMHPDEHRGQDSQGPFDFTSFLENLNSQLGINLQEFLGNIGGASSEANHNHDEVDFVPRADIFDTPTEYVVHVSLPGAVKEDISVEYDTVNSTLRLAGVVFRPDVDESLNSRLVVSGRDREVGVFEKQARLGTRGAPANVDVEGTHAKMVDGVLVVKLPKLAQQEEAGTKVRVEHVEKDTGGKEKASHETDVDSQTEVGDTDGGHTSYSPMVNDEADEADYITVDVD